MSLSYSEMVERLSLVKPGANLAGHYFAYFDLQGVDLSGACLADANLECADLRGAKLVGADLTDADLTGACLNGANLKGANLANANLEGARLKGANLEGACLEGANLEDAAMYDSVLKYAYLKDVNLLNACLDNADLTRAYLAHANLTGASLIDTVFAHARLEYVSFIGADLSDANFDGANIKNTIFFEVTGVDDDVLSELVAESWEQDTLSPSAGDHATDSTQPNQNPTQPNQKVTHMAADSSVSDWNSLAVKAATEGIKDGTAAAAAEIITDAVVGTLSGFVPALSLINSNEYGRSVLLVATPWAIGAATHLFPDLVPGDATQVRRICYRAIRGSATIRFAPIIARLKAPLAEAFGAIRAMEEA